MGRTKTTAGTRCGVAIVSASERRIAELEAEVGKLRHLLKSQMQSGEELEFEAIVNLDGKPLVNLRWDNLAAQIPTDEARDMAHNLLRVCEWADVDSQMFTVLRAEFDERTAAGFMALMREARPGGHRDHSAAA